jgi:hypothetical protein
MSSGVNALHERMKTVCQISSSNKILPVLETSFLSTFNHLTRLEARENFIILSRRESLKSYNFICLNSWDMVNGFLIRTFEVGRVNERITEF